MESLPSHKSCLPLQLPIYSLPGSVALRDASAPSTSSFSSASDVCLLLTRGHSQCSGSTVVVVVVNSSSASVLSPCLGVCVLVPVAQCCCQGVRRPRSGAIDWPSLRCCRPRRGGAATCQRSRCSSVGCRSHQRASPGSIEKKNVATNRCGSRRFGGALPSRAEVCRRTYHKPTMYVKASGAHYAAVAGRTVTATLVSFLLTADQLYRQGINLLDGLCLICVLPTTPLWPRARS